LKPVRVVGALIALAIAKLAAGHHLTAQSAHYRIHNTTHYSGLVLLFLLLRYTRLGIRIRAGTLDLETVSTLGVNVKILRNLNFGLGIYLAGLAGTLAAGMLGLQPNIGNELIMPSFVAIIIGGLGSLLGTLFGGLLIGIAMGITAVFFPSASEAVIYVLMGLVLLVRPFGLFGAVQMRKI